MFARVIPTVARTGLRYGSNVYPGTSVLAKVCVLCGHGRGWTLWRGCSPCYGGCKNRHYTTLGWLLLARSSTPALRRRSALAETAPCPLLMVRCRRLWLSPR